jgi:hypothetical protein
VKMTIEEAIKELYFWKAHAGTATNFTAKLYDLISKADPQNKEALRKGFSLEVAAWEAWQDSIDEEKFFASHGLGRKAVDK